MIFREIYGAKETFPITPEEQEKQLNATKTVDWTDKSLKKTMSNFDKFINITILLVGLMTLGYPTAMLFFS